jgi:hypothetical protein
MPNIYSTGLVSITSNTDIVTGTGTLFITAGALVPGGLITFDDGAVFYRVKAVDSNTQLTIEALITNGLYVGPTLVDQAYQIYRAFERTLSSAIAAQILDNVEYRLIDQINFSAWAFSADNDYTFLDSLGNSQTILTPKGIALNTNIGGGITTNSDGTFTLTSNGQSAVIRNGIDGRDSVPIITPTATGYMLTWSNGQTINITDGVSPLAGHDYVDGRNGNYVSFIFRTGLTVPSTPVGGTYDGIDEVVPASWDDNYVYAAGYITYISKGVYVDNGNTWVNQGWGTPAPFATQGNTGGQGNPGSVGPQGPGGTGGLAGVRGFAGDDGINIETKLVSNNGYIFKNNTGAVKTITAQVFLNGVLSTLHETYDYIWTTNSFPIYVSSNGDFISTSPGGDTYPANPTVENGLNFRSIKIDFSDVTDNDILNLTCEVAGI